MSKLKKLIQELCPNGVEYKKLGGVCEIRRGERVVKSQLLNAGSYPVISGGINPMGYLNAYNRDSETITIAQYGTAGYVSWQTTKFWANDVCYCLYPESVLNKKYLYYCLKKQQRIIDSMVIKDAIPYHLPLYQLQKVEIPIPPREVQEEIVRILDHFSLLAAELQAELQARQAQYEYYRNKLLTFSEGGVRWMRMSEIGTFIRGNGLQKKDFKERGVPCIHYGQIYTHYKTFTAQTLSYISSETAKKCKKAHTGDLIFASTSENVEDVGKTVAWLGEEDIAISNHTLIFSHNQNPIFLSYLFQTERFIKYKKTKAVGVKVIDIPQKALENFCIPIPSMEEQEYIVSILNNFETLVRDISRGLPAEITAVQEQYEYYRNKLLSFPSNKVSA